MSAEQLSGTWRTIKYAHIHRHRHTHLYTRRTLIGISTYDSISSKCCIYYFLIAFGDDVVAGVSPEIEQLSKPGEGGAGGHGQHTHTKVLHYKNTHSYGDYYRIYK